MLQRIIVSGISVFLMVFTAATPASAHNNPPANTTSNSSTTNTTTATNNNEVTNLIQSGLLQGTYFNFTPTSTSTTTTPPSSKSGNGSTPTWATSGAYVALGDSVAAGLGLRGAVSTPSAERRCGRTAQAYPYAVAGTLNLPLVHRACSGATTRDLYTTDWVPSPSIPAQLTTAFSGGTPHLITITSGANDIRWLGFLDSCNRRNCATTASTTVLNNSLLILEGRLERVFREIDRRSGSTSPVVIMTEYYDPVSSACNNVTPNITPEEIAWISNGVARLNRTIVDAASEYPFVRVAPVNFTGHDFCSSDSWVQGLNSPAPFHPTAEGQRVIAQSVVTTYNNR